MPPVAAAGRLILRGAVGSIIATMLPWFHPFDGCAAFVLALDLHLSLLVPIAFFDIDNVLAILEEDGHSRQIEHILFGAAEKDDLGSEAGAKARIFIGELNGDVEVAAGVGGEELSHAHSADALDGSVKNLPRQSIEDNLDRLAHSHITAILLTDFGGQVKALGVDHLGNRCSRLRPGRPRGSREETCR